jgi:hypothetical protein
LFGRFGDRWLANAKKGSPTKELQGVIYRLPDNALNGISVAVFDTRFSTKMYGIGLRSLMKSIGFAAKNCQQTASQSRFDCSATGRFYHR